MGRQEMSCNNDACFSVLPNGEDFFIDKQDCEVKVDITTEQQRRVVVIWGHVSDCRGRPIEAALVKLLKYDCGCGRNLHGIGHTLTDCQGYYQFGLPANSEGKYRVVVSRAAFGREREVKEDCGQCHNCGQCHDCDCNCGHDCRPCNTPPFIPEDCGCRPKSKICYY